MESNPYESPANNAAPPPDVPLRRGPSFFGVVIVLGAIAIVIALLIPMPRNAREAARKAQCINNLKQINLALLNYESTFGTFPPAYTVDAEGNRLHSWRTLILPFIEKAAFYKKIDFNKPWDAPENKAARDRVMPPYVCPSTDIEPGLTTYLAVVSPDGIFSGEHGRPMSDVQDGASNIILLVDVDPKHAVHWMSPYDVDEDWWMNIDKLEELAHAGRINVAYGDGRAGSIETSISKEKLRALLTIAGGDSDVFEDAD